MFLRWWIQFTFLHIVLELLGPGRSNRWGEVWFEFCWVFLKIIFLQNKIQSNFERAYVWVLGLQVSTHVLKGSFLMFFRCWVRGHLAFFKGGATHLFLPPGTIWQPNPIYSIHPNTLSEGVLGMFWGSICLLRRLLDVYRVTKTLKRPWFLWPDVIFSGLRITIDTLLVY